MLKYINPNAETKVIRMKRKLGKPPSKTEKEILVSSPSSKSGKTHHLTYLSALSSYFNEWYFDENKRTLFVKPDNYGSFIGTHGSNIKYLKKIYIENGLNIELIKKKPENKWKSHPSSDGIIYENKGKRIKYLLKTNPNERGRYEIHMYINKSYNVREFNSYDDAQGWIMLKI